MKYLILILSIFFIFACATTKNLTESEKLEIVLDVVRDLDKEKTKPHITIEELMTDDWENIATEPYLQSGYIDFYLISRNFNANIQYAAVRYVPQYQMVIGYAYMFESEIYVFQTDEEGGFELAELGNEDIEFWISQFKKYFLEVEGLVDC